MNNATLAAEGQSNFLIPNGTFFAVLIIFLIVLGVIWKFVVPPISEALAARADLVAKTTDDNHKAAKAFADAESKYKQELTEARGEATKIRDEARAEGQGILDRMRGEARQEADAISARATDELTEEGNRVTTQLRESVGPLSRSLADRVLGSERSAVGASNDATERS